MAHDRVDDDVGVAAGRVDRAVAGRDRGQARLHARARPARSASRRPPGWPPSARRSRPARSGPGRRRSRRAGRRTRRRAPRAASGSHSALASENATISPRARCTAASWARILPPRGSSSTTSAPASRARAAVASVQPSQATITSSSSRGIVERERVGDLRGDHRLSSCAATISDRERRLGLAGGGRGVGAPARAAARAAASAAA